MRLYSGKREQKSQHWSRPGAALSADFARLCPRLPAIRQRYYGMCVQSPNRGFLQPPAEPHLRGVGNVPLCPSLRSSFARTSLVQNLVHEWLSFQSLLGVKWTLTAPLRIDEFASEPVVVHSVQQLH